MQKVVKDEMWTMIDLGNLWWWIPWCKISGADIASGKFSAAKAKIRSVVSQMLTARFIPSSIA